MAIVYLAGKIRRDCWRHSIVDGLDEQAWNSFQDDSDGGNPSSWGILPKAVFGEHDYCGPFFIRCSHYGWHGPTEHGCGMSDVQANLYGTPNCCGDVDVNRQWVHDQCLRAISRSTHVFSWIESTDCFGTIYELGIARALGKKICVASSLECGKEYVSEDGRHPHDLEDQDEVEYFHWPIPKELAELWLSISSTENHLFGHTNARDALKEFLYPPLEAWNGYVYFIEATGIGHVKIGWSHHPHKRLAQLQTGSSSRLILLGTIAASQSLEKKLHADFKHLRHHDEWFHGTEELRSYIRSQCQEVNA